MVCSLQDSVVLQFVRPLPTVRKHTPLEVTAFEGARIFFSWNSRFCLGYLSFLKKYEVQVFDTLILCSWFFLVCAACICFSQEIEKLVHSAVSEKYSSVMIATDALQNVRIIIVDFWYRLQVGTMLLLFGNYIFFCQNDASNLNVACVCVIACARFDYLWLDCT